MIFTSTILMLRPARFGYNEQTASSNSFQQKVLLEDIQEKVLREFNEMVNTLRSAGITVIVKEDTPEPVKPDAIFPNNWFCTLPDRTVATFPMYATNRRAERRADIISWLKHEFDLTILKDLGTYEVGGIFLEGTGSMVMDHEHRMIFAAISERTHPSLLRSFGEMIGYETIEFSARDKKGIPIYHTNVLMCMGNGFCVACDEVIDQGDKQAFFATIERSRKQFISISYEQMTRFAGNMLQLQNRSGEFYLVMSQSAFDALTEVQKETLKTFTKLLPVQIPTIETLGGGSARCMMAEIFC